MQLHPPTRPWSCILDAFAMAMDIHPNYIINELGHDGSEILWPGNDDPYCRRGFHIQELIAIAIKNGYSVTEVQTKPLSAPSIVDNMAGHKIINVLDVMRGNKGVILMQGHAVAWDGVKVYDPRGMTYDTVGDFESFYLIRPTAAISDLKIKSEVCFLS